jgi:hypothetical protein
MKCFKRERPFLSCFLVALLVVLLFAANVNWGLQVAHAAGIENGVNVVTVKPMNNFEITSFETDLQNDCPMLLAKKPSILARGYVKYSDFGATGDGIVNDFLAIIDAHNFANSYNLPVRADANAVYFIGDPPTQQNAEGAYVVKHPHGASIKTDTDWNGAKFIIDDTCVAVTFGVGRNSPHNSPIFTVAPTVDAVDILPHLPVAASGNKQLGAGQARLDFVAGLNLENGAMIVITDGTATVTRKMFGSNKAAHEPKPKQDVIVVDKNGYVDKDTPILWDFNNITELTAYPFENQTLNISGGNFSRLARRENLDTFFFRGINVRRNNVVIDGLAHSIYQPLDDITPSRHHYSACDGIVMITNTSNVTLKNSQLSGTRNGYDFSVYLASHIYVENVHQKNCHIDRNFWGIMGANDVKNIFFDNVTFSRFDIHRQVHNATVINSDLGWAGIPVTGGGTLYIENTVVRHPNVFIDLREDWGSSWNGNVYIKNCTWIPSGGNAKGNLYIFQINNNGKFNFGYPTYMPRKIEIDGLKIVNEDGAKIEGRRLHLVNNFSRLSQKNAISKTQQLVINDIDRNLTVPLFLKSGLTVLGEGYTYDFKWVIAGSAIGVAAVAVCTSLTILIKKKKRKRNGKNKSLS